MLRRFWAVLAALFARLRDWLRKQSGRPRGSWIEGSAEAPGARLAFAPWAGGLRPYRLYLPPGLDAATTAPLWVWLHGCRQTPYAFATGSRVALAADEAGAVVLLPRQLRRANPFRCWNWFDRDTQQGRGEAAIVLAMIEAVAANYRIDRERVFVAGLSAGAGLACVLASRYPERFAAVAMHSGVSYAAAQSPLTARAAIAHGSSLSGEASAALARLFAQSALPVPALALHGEADAAVPPLHLDQVVAHFLAFNRQGAEAATESSIEASAGGLAYRVTDWRQQGRLLVRRILISGLGHAWSGGEASEEYHAAAGPEATRLIAEFFGEEARRAGA